MRQIDRCRINANSLAAVLSLAAVGCADVSDSSSSSALETHAIPDSFETEDGLTWLRAEKAVFDTRPDDVVRKELARKAVDGAAASKVAPDPEKLTDEQWGKEMEPLTEFGGFEYRLTGASLKQYGASLRAKAVRRKKDPSFESEAVGALGASGNRSIASGLPVDTRAQKGIIGSDNRFGIDGYRSVYPFNNHATMEAFNSDGTVSVCTAFKVINHHTAGTAAHCVHTGSGWKTRAELTFSDGRLGKVPAGCYSRTINGGWNSASSFPKNDYAVIALKRARSNTSCNVANYDVGYLGYKSVGYTATIRGFVSGYPSSGSMPPGLSGYPHLVYHYEGNAEVGVFQPDVLQYYNDATGGQSGAPFMTWNAENNDYRVRAIHKGDVDRPVIADYNQGREFNGAVADFFKSSGGDSI